MELADVERAMLADWAVRGAAAPTWPNPHSMVTPADDEYERVTDWSKDGVTDSGVVIGDRWLPPCGCDACDSGSEHELDEVDALFADVLSGELAGDRHSWLD